MKNLIFLHGFPFNSSMWQPQLSAFENKCHVYAPDLRGHGSGPRGPGPWMIDHFVDDIKSLIEQNELKKVTICGLSMGGYIALNFAQKYPDSLAGLVLSDTQAEDDSNEAKEKRYAFILRMQSEGQKNFAHEFSKLVLSENTMMRNPEIQESIISMILQNSPKEMAMVAGALASRRNCKPFLKNISCPTLVLVGADDKVTTVEVNFQLAKDIKDSDFKIIEKAGHLPNLEQPETFNRHLDEFISQKLK